MVKTLPPWGVSGSWRMTVTYPAPRASEPDSGTAPVRLTGPGLLGFALVLTGAGADHLTPLHTLAALHRTLPDEKT